ncbi:hypothetical protein INS49_014086 [Diaporthe citri]|uniref:uncharacterized protein n=1 Tax=Diaporthe citri TaxID=83186 RepID=UPI001C7F0083|nr:uncharacterized protein INS49_014086 [Diaporthe citri]KAG6358202.1 hypothetical protein INS49_014086 [Diaporthe citri]
MSLARHVAGALSKRRRPSYRYSALEKPTSVRLLQLSPKTDDYLIHCTLIEVNLSSNPSYEALSYTWAIDSDISEPRTGGPSRTVICNGATLDVFKNLHNALSQLQELGWTSTPIWIDAICINQRDDTEKSAQVNMMGDIFRAAERVVVWLGKSSYATDIALAKARPFFTDGILPQDVSSNWAAVSSRGAVLVAYEALNWVLSRGWFGRVWTLQEAALARETVYLLGSQTVPFDELLNCSGHACTLEAAVTEARNRRAVDGRDNLFGVLSLCDPEDAAGLAADYQKSVQDVFCECAAALLRSKNTGLTLLSMVGQIRHGYDLAYAFHSKYIDQFRPEKGFVTDLPSWVPDLSAPARPVPLRNLSAIEFSAAGSVEPKFSITGSKGRVLELKITVLDTISATGDCRSARLVRPIWRFLRLLRNLPRHSEGIYLPTGEPIVSALWRTLAAGATHAMDDPDEQTIDDPDENATEEPEKHTLDQPGADEDDADTALEIELTDSHFVEWFAIFAEETCTLSEMKMRDGILKEQDDNDLDLGAEPDDRHRLGLRELLRDKEMEKLDRYKIHAIREFLASFDSPAYGFREAIRLRHERFKGMSRVDVEVEQKLWTSKDPLFEDVFEKFYADRRMFSTKKGYLGTAPWTAVEGDVVMLVAGASVPYVFRPSERTKGGWELVGEAYCHGFMFGEGTKIEGNDFQTIIVV